ncbi:MAG TPA: class I SAM-dependent methyltransferase [Burkholderiales bacterium]|nr:class I SAM-dependent methyltransferase [Burkholderiales bacterium]
MKPCAVCRNTIDPFLSFGRMPIANGFLTEAEFAGEAFFELAVGFCPRCRMVQLTELVAREKMFHENYAYFSSTSIHMSEHFRRLAEAVRSAHLTGADPFVVEIGSNDGILLRHFAGAGIRHLGVEPSANVAQVARDKGVRTVDGFFDETLARRILEEHGQADALLGANVMCHLPYLHSVIAGVRLLLKPRGVLVFEDPYLGDIVEKTSYDQIYDEHAFYFSLTALDHLFAGHGMEIVDAVPQKVHGGSMRYTVAHAGAHAPAAAVDALRARERALGLGEAATFERFRRRVEASRDSLVRLLQRLKAEGRRVAGYGATSKSTTVTNYCGITASLVEFISDTTPIKQGKFNPGTHIPVRPHAEFARRRPDCALLFAWNHGEEVMAKELAFTAAGGRWITYVPRVEVSG